MNDIHNSIKSDLSEITTAQKSLEKSLSNLSIDLIKRFEDMIELQNNLNFIPTIPSNDETNNNSIRAVTPVRDVTNHQQPHGIERTPSRLRIAEELQKRTILKKSSGSNHNIVSE